MKKLALPDTGAWTGYGTVTDTLMLRAGSNDDLDPLRRGRRRQRQPRLPRRDAEQARAVRPDVGAGRRGSTARALDRCRWTTIVNEDPSGYALADGKLQIEAQEGDIVGGTFTAAQRLAAAGARGRQLGGEDDALHRRDGRLRPGRAHRARSGQRVGQARGDAQPGGPVGARARPRRRAGRTARRCPRARSRTSRWSCSRPRAGCAAATRSTTARPGPRSAPASR